MQEGTRKEGPAYSSCSGAKDPGTERDVNRTDFYKVADYPRLAKHATRVSRATGGRGERI